MDKPRRNQEKCLPRTSSTPSRLPRKQEGLFREILLLLEEKKIPFTVSGAFALKQHTGICRDTKDLDLFLSTKNAARALACLRNQGFETEVRDPVWLAKAHRDKYFVDLITGMSNGVITVDASWIRRSYSAEVFGVQTRVLAPEELIASKLFVTRRERFDGADIAHVIYGTQGKIDWKRLFHLVGQHWEMLFWALLLFRYVYPAQSQYVPAVVWQDLIQRFSEAVAKPPVNANFRGSLVDDLMFAIDIQEWGLKNMLAEYRERAPKIVVEPLASCA
jgi:hypothetical protein